VIRRALGVDFCPRPCGNSYVPTSGEFDLLEEMARMGLVKYKGSAFDRHYSGVADHGAHILGLTVPTREEIRWFPHPVPAADRVRECQGRSGQSSMATVATLGRVAIWNL
jgi:hypothetical protein